jgi:rhodanese-related sulfurtransferase
MASPARLELLDLLCQAPRTVEALASEAGLSIANTSQHLRVLHASRLVQCQKDGLFVTYRLAGEQVCDFYRVLRGLAENRLAEIEGIIRQLKAGQEGMEPVDKRTLLKRARRAEVTVLDVRPAEEYRAGHIPGAISIPLQQLRRRLSTLPRDREIVAYCRGPYCVLAVDAVKLLRARGFAAVRLEDGLPEWRAQGLPVAVGDAPI